MANYEEQFGHLDEGTKKVFVEVFSPSDNTPSNCMRTVIYENTVEHAEQLGFQFSWAVMFNVPGPILAKGYAQVFSDAEQQASLAKHTIIAEAMSLFIKKMYNL